MIKRIALVTDFGGSSPYTGQLPLVLHGLLPSLPVFDLISDLTPFRADLAAYFLPALIRDLPGETLYLCVLDPGVGGDRGAIQMRADGNWFVGPDNGLLAMVAQRAEQLYCRHVDWRPQQISNSFHGRDLFAYIAASIVRGELLEGADLGSHEIYGHDWPRDCSKVIYADGFGNLCCGIRAAGVARSARVLAADRELLYSRTFCEVSAGAAFWYENSFGLIELAVNQGRADRQLGLRPGDPIQLTD